MAKTEITYVVHMIRERNTAARFFAVLKKAPDFGHAFFHAVGVWVDKDPKDSAEMELDVQSIREEYIPWHRIDHVTNNMYRPR